MQCMKKDGLINRSFPIIAGLNSLAVMFALSIYAYGGLFSRYLADDYCESTLLNSSGNFLAATIAGYQTWFNSYSILFFVQLTDWAGLWGFRFMSAVTLIFWTASLTWLIAEIGKAIQIRLSPSITLWIAGLVIFISLYQTPALYQILYWRTSLIPYTLPLVFFAGIAAYILWYARQPFQRSKAVWSGVICFASVFFASGLGETTSALQVGFLFLAVVVVWLTKSLHRRGDVLAILTISLACAVVSLLIIAFSPGTLNRLGRIMNQSPIYNPIELSMQVIVVTFQFLRDAIITSPLPALIVTLIPFGIMYFQNLNGSASGIPTSGVRIAILLTVLLMFILIGFSFAPSSFVRSFPVARARFAAHFVMTFSLALSGGLLGILASRLRIPLKTSLIRSAIVLLLGLLIVYPLRAGMKIYISTYEYRGFAAAWDERDAYIRKSVSEGAKDLVVVQLDSIGGVGEYKGNERHWINRCAANYYGLDTLRAP